MAQIAFIDLARMVFDAGPVAGGLAQSNAIALVCAESNRNPAAQYVNTDGSIDRGLWQFNSKWHPEVTDVMAYDPKVATREAFRVSKSFTDFTPWSAWQNGSYKPHLEAAKVALDGLQRVKNLQSDLDAANNALSSCTNDLTVVKNQLTAAQANNQDLMNQVADLQVKLAIQEKKVSDALAILGG